ncbi:MAG: TIGR03545 family protein [Pseudobdellovibrionaceae bacterium]|nr:MAG: TIGR03545 family protein [Pseudobdellovibrionaceae bacterium]
MTASTDKKDTKKKKPKGPIRFEAIIPTVVVVALLIGYFTFLFDSQLKSALEWGGTQVHGAEVNIRSLNISFVRADLSISGIEVTDKEQPEQNLLQVGRIRFKLLWDALLRAKFVVDDATIENIQTGVPRTRPGRVLPVKPPQEGNENQTVREVEAAAVAKAKSDFGGNILGDVAAVMGGTAKDDQLKSIQGELKAEARMKEVEKALKEKQSEWSKRISELPTGKELDALIARAKVLKFDTNNPAQFAKDLEALNAIAKEADAKLKLVEKTSKDLDSDSKSIDGAFKEIDQLVKQDLADLQKRLKLPSLNVGEFSKGLFASMLAEKMGSLHKYMVMAHEYMPPKKTKKEKEAQQAELLPKQRGKGKDFRFPITKGYPTFWLKHAAISSEPSDSEYSGRMKGEVNHITTSPSTVGLPMTIVLEGDFPKQGIQDFSTNIVIDHTTASPAESFVTQVGSYPVGRQVLSDSEDVKLAIVKSKGGMTMQGERKNKIWNLLLENSFREIDYELNARSTTMKEVLTGVAQDLPTVSLRAKAQGPFENLKWDVYSNLGDELAKGFKKQLDNKIKEAQAKLKALVDERINKQRAELEGQANKIKADLNKQVDQAKQKVAAAKTSAQQEGDKRKKELENSNKKKVEKAGKKAVDDLKKSLGF